MPVRQAVVALLAISVFSGAARAGSRYFFCNAMQESRSEPCCKRTPAPTSQADADCACCRAHSVPGLPSALMGKSVGVPDGIWVGLAPRAPRLLPPAHSLPPPRFIRPQTGPPRLPHLALLMVFRN